VTQLSGRRVGTRVLPLVEPAMKSALRKHYDALWPQLHQTLPTDQGVSQPLLISIPERYLSADLRLMIVGKETHGWEGHLGEALGNDPVGELQRRYSAFELGKTWNSPFCVESHRLAQLLGPEVPPCGFVWSNIFLCDQKKGRPNAAITKSVLAPASLAREVEILKPHAVVFFTGPYYDEFLKQLFRGATIGDCRGFPNRVLGRVKHDLLPWRSFRTYHPKYLWLQRKRELIREVVTLIREGKSVPE
jgi:hypothetical protein